MIESILSIVATVLGWFGYGGSKDDTAAAERASGVAQGRAEQALADTQKDLDNVAKANAASDAVTRERMLNRSSVYSDDGYRRPD